MYLIGFGERLRRARKRAGWSAVRVGERLGVSHDMITHYESERTLPTIDKVFAMANLYGVSIDWLCGVGVEK